MSEDPIKKEETPQVQERVYKFIKRETPESEPVEIDVKESELTEDQKRAIFGNLAYMFNTSPVSVQAEFIDWVLELMSKATEEMKNEIITPSKTIVDAEGQPMKSSNLHKVE